MGILAPKHTHMHTLSPFIRLSFLIFDRFFRTGVNRLELLIMKLIWHKMIQVFSFQSPNYTRGLKVQLSNCHGQCSVGAVYTMSTHALSLDQKMNIALSGTEDFIFIHKS